jgi:hypothetical protein
MNSPGDAKPAEARGSGSSLGMIVLLFASVVAASANTVLFKIALNAFSSPTTNYGFFVSQFSTLLYTFQAVVVSAILVWRNPSSKLDVSWRSQPTYVYMGALDAASATLGAIAGVDCPGEMQTILNQMAIPFTMLFALYFLGSNFEQNQVWGSVLIVLGSILASSDYFMEGSGAPSDDSPQISKMVLLTSIILYFISVIPSGFSNVYKESKMKEMDMNEVHVSTVVSFWQLWIGFVFLPLMALPQLGGLSYAEMTSQLGDGFQCFMGTNPRDPADQGCTNAAALLMTYIVLNFVYNIMMLAITKKGSAVLLVTSQALSLPITNIAFTLRPLMGDDAEPLSMTDLAGLVLVCIGFVAYSGFGFAKNFMVAQGPPGQMAYAHFEDHDEMVVSTKVTVDPEQLADFIVGGIIREHMLYVEQQLSELTDDAVPPPGVELTEVDADAGATDSSALIAQPNLRRRQIAEITPLEACATALRVLKTTTALVAKQEQLLREGDKPAYLSSPAILNRLDNLSSRNTGGNHAKSKGYGTRSNAEC